MWYVRTMKPHSKFCYKFSVTTLLGSVNHFARGSTEDSSRYRFVFNGIQRIACFIVFFHNSKIKFGKIWNLVFLSIQPIPDLSYKFDHFWGKIYIFLFRLKKIHEFHESMKHQNPKKKNSSKVIKFTWKIWNRLNRKKNQISDFSDFYFSSYAENNEADNSLKSVERKPVPTRVFNP